jgi:hypothetical protein
MGLKWVDSVRLPEPTRTYWRGVASAARPSRSGLVTHLVIAVAVLVVVFAITREADVALVATVVVIVVLLAALWLRAVMNAAAMRDRDHQDQARSHREAIANLEQQLLRARWAHQVRQDVLGDLLRDLPERQSAGDVREALIDAAKRCGTFNVPESLALVPARLYELADGYKTHGEAELASVSRAVRTLQTSSMADPEP